MAKFVNNEPKFKVGDKVVYIRRGDFITGWEAESISKEPLTISEVDKLCENGKLVDVNYWVKGLDYVYSENWLAYAPARPKFKIGDLVRVKTFVKPIREITDVVTITSARDNHTKYSYSLKGEPFRFEEDDLEVAISNEEQLVRDLEICGGNPGGCKGCSRLNPDGSFGDGCDKLELDAAEFIKKLQKRVKELEEKKRLHPVIKERRKYGEIQARTNCHL